MAAALVGEGEGDVARVVAFQLSEYRLNMRSVVVDIRHHHDHVAGLELRVGAEGGEQLVVENFHFALGAVGGVEDEGVVVVRVHRRPGLAGLVQRAQLADVVLQLLQQPAVAFAHEGLEQVDAQRVGPEQGLVLLGVVVLVEQAQVVAALLAPGGQQRLGVQVQALGSVITGVANAEHVEPFGHAGLAPLSVALGAEQVLVFDDVGPVVLAGVVHAQHHLAAAGDGGQGFQRLLGQRGDAEHHHTPRQAGGAFAAVKLTCGGEKAPVHHGAAGGHSVVAHVLGNAVHHGPPQGRLPALGVIQRAGFAAGGDQHVLAASPGLEPVGAVHLVLVEQVGQALGELMVLAQVAVAFEEAAQRGELVTRHQFRQQAQQSPQ